MQKMETAPRARRNRRALVSLLPLAVATLTGAYAPGLYFTSCDVNEISDDRLERVDLDGSNGTLLFGDFNAFEVYPSFPLGIAIDPVEGTAYVAIGGYVSTPYSSEIWKFDLAGNLLGSPIELDDVTPVALALDVNAHQLYFSVFTGDLGSVTGDIRVADLNSPSPSTIVSGLIQPLQLALDLAGGWIYWADSGAGKIQRATLDGITVEDLVTGLSRPMGVALDLVHGKLYFSESDVTTGTAGIYRADLDGTNVAGIVDCDVDPCSSPSVLAIDAEAGKLYGEEFSTYEIFSVDLVTPAYEGTLTSHALPSVGLALLLPACRDGYDNDGNNFVDAPNDPGCRDREDYSEAPDCSDGLDNDGDGRIDFDPVTYADAPSFTAGTGDPACSFAGGQREVAACQNGLDDDHDGRADFDGGQSIHGACQPPALGGCPPGVTDVDEDGVADPDPQCTDAPWATREKAKSCGLGAELALLVGVVRGLRRRRWRGGRSAPGTRFPGP